jgi:hypothetical protein
MHVVRDWACEKRQEHDTVPDCRRAVTDRRAFYPRCAALLDGAAANASLHIGPERDEYLFNAIEAFDGAQEMTDPDSKAAMLGIAASYELLAERSAKRANLQEDSAAPPPPGRTDTDKLEQP